MITTFDTFITIDITIIVEKYAHETIRDHEHEQRDHELYDQSVPHITK